MMETPHEQHGWLSQLVGAWTYESTCRMGPDTPPVTSTGREVVTSIGDFWVVHEATGEMPDGTATVTRLTLGFDPTRSKFVGNFVASMMSHQWLYEGSLDATGKVLDLASSGPSMSGDGAQANYIDTIRIIDADTREFSSRIEMPDGQWVDFMLWRLKRVR